MCTFIYAVGNFLTCLCSPCLSYDFVAGLRVNSGLTGKLHKSDVDTEVCIRCTKE